MSLFLSDIHTLPFIKPSVLLPALSWLLEDHFCLLKFDLSRKLFLKHDLLRSPFLEAPMQYSLICSLIHSLIHANIH